MHKYIIAEWPIRTYHVSKPTTEKDNAAEHMVIYDSVVSSYGGDIQVIIHIAYGYRAFTKYSRVGRDKYFQNLFLPLLNNGV